MTLKPCFFACIFIFILIANFGCAAFMMNPEREMRMCCPFCMGDTPYFNDNSSIGGPFFVYDEGRFVPVHNRIQTRIMAIQHGNYQELTEQSASDLHNTAANFGSAAFTMNPEMWIRCPFCLDDRRFNANSSIGAPFFVYDEGRFVPIHNRVENRIMSIQNGIYHEFSDQFSDQSAIELPNAAWEQYDPTSVADQSHQSFNEQNDNESNALENQNSGTLHHQPRQEFTEQSAIDLPNAAWEQYGHTSMADQSHQSFNVQNDNESHALEQYFTEQSASALRDDFWEQVDNLLIPHQSHHGFTDQEEQQVVAAPAPSASINQASGDLQQPLGSTAWLLTESYAPSPIQPLQQTMQYGLTSPLAGYMETLMPHAGVIVEPRQIRPGWKSYQLPSVPLVNISVPYATSHTEFIQALRGEEERYRVWSQQLERFVRQSNALINIRQFYWSTSFFQNDGQLCFELIAPDTSNVREWVELIIDNLDSGSGARSGQIAGLDNRAQDEQHDAAQSQQYTTDNYDGDLQHSSATVINGVSSTPSSPSTIGPASPRPLQCLNGNDDSA